MAVFPAGEGAFHSYESAIHIIVPFVGVQPDGIERVKYLRVLAVQIERLLFEDKTAITLDPDSFPFVPLRRGNKLNQ
jgi:hypothetical protein